MIPDHHVREIRAMYEERVLRPRREGKKPEHGIVKHIAVMYNTSTRWVYLIGMRLARENVPDVPTEPDPKSPAKDTPNTIAQRRIRARRTAKPRGYPSHRDTRGRFTSDP